MGWLSIYNWYFGPQATTVNFIYVCSSHLDGHFVGQDPNEAFALKSGTEVQVGSLSLVQLSYIFAGRCNKKLGMQRRNFDSRLKTWPNLGYLSVVDQLQLKPFPSLSQFLCLGYKWWYYGWAKSKSPVDRWSTCVNIPLFMYDMVDLCNIINGISQCL